MQVLRRAVAALVAACTLPLALGACNGAPGASDPVVPAAPKSLASVSATPAVRTPSVIFSPQNGAAAVPADTSARVLVSDGTIESVAVATATGVALAGALSTDRSSWTASSHLAYGSHYSARVVVRNEAGALTSLVSAFTTVAPKTLVTTSISPLRGTEVGVGMPIVVKLSVPVTNRAAVERGLVVSASRPVEGSWSWISSEELHYRPRVYWPENTDVRLDVKLVGVDAGDGVWGGKDRTVGFHVGATTISIVDVRTLRMKVYTGAGRLLRIVPVTTGKADWLTRNGIKVVSEKYPVKLMDAATMHLHPGDPNYYRLNVPYALRVTWSGEFVHGAPWSLASQGHVRVSHGCVGMSLADAKWLFARSRIGDIVQVVGSPRPLEPNNGWTDWNVAWARWRAGSALTS